MQYLISFALLVALLAWVVGVYNHLVHLRSAVCKGWLHWRKTARRRNACLRDFVRVFAPAVPVNDPLPRSLLRLAADSEHSLTLADTPRWGRSHAFLGGAEHLLRMAIIQSLRMAETSSAGLADAQLATLCSRLSASLGQQDEAAELFNRAVREYNTALAVPSARLLAPVFGFAAAESLEPPQMQHARSS